MKYILDRIDKDERQATKRKKKEEGMEAKRRLANASKLSSLLYRHKESLKMEILKKRALLDKELQLEAQVWSHIFSKRDVWNEERWLMALETSLFLLTL